MVRIIVIGFISYEGVRFIITKVKNNVNKLSKLFK
jgi:hypothetical protein